MAKILNPYPNLNLGILKYKRSPLVGDFHILKKTATQNHNNMKIPRLAVFISLGFLSLLLLAMPLSAQENQTPPATGNTPAISTNQTTPGAGNADAIKIALNSPLVQSAQEFLVQQTKRIQNPTLRHATLDAINNRKTCITHRAGLTDTDKQDILQKLVDAGLVDTGDDSTFPGGLINGVFPPVLNDGSHCPQLPQPFFAAPGSTNNSHHAYPGGLPVHESFNNLSGLSFATNYRLIYGQSRRDGLPIINPFYNNRNSDIYISDDLLSGAPIWHDWAKPIVFQWNADGTEFQELNFGGNGKTDDFDGATGNSKTGGHHIIGLAEAIKRGLSPEFVITQASAHSAPTLGNEYKVVNWLRAAAIIAQIDPVEQGYLFVDSQNRLRLPPVRQLGKGVDLTAVNETNLLAEYALHNLSDADFVLTIPAITIDLKLLSAIAPRFGYSSTDTGTYITKFRNPVLSYLSAERLLIIYGNDGLDGVIAEVNKLRRKGII